MQWKHHRQETSVNSICLIGAAVSKCAKELMYIWRHITGVCCNFCTCSLPRGGQQHLDVWCSINVWCTCSLLHAAAPVFLTSWLPHPLWHGGKALHCSAPPCKTSLFPSLHLWGCPPALSHSFMLLSVLWVCRCAPHVFVPLHTYLSTPACEYLHVADFTYLVLFHSVLLHVFMTLKALLFPAKLLRLHSLL